MIQKSHVSPATKFYNHGIHGKHGKRLTTKHTNHTKKIIVNFLLRKNLTIYFVKNVQKNKKTTDCIAECPKSKGIPLFVIYVFE